MRMVAFTASIIQLALILSLCAEIGQRAEAGALIEQSPSAKPDNVDATTPDARGPKASCQLFKDIGVNDLSINDVVVKNSSGNQACIKARFSLAIKVEAGLDSSPDGGMLIDDGNDQQVQEDRVTLGFLPLDSIVSVEDTCPETKADDRDNSKSANEKKGTQEVNEVDEQEMIVKFECGKLGFIFKKAQDAYYLAAIRGAVNLDASTTREFIAERPMFATSDLSHHFKFNDLIEVDSTASVKAFYLTANFYNSEFEAFRDTNSRDFIRPQDDNSIPIPDKL